MKAQKEININQSHNLDFVIKAKKRLMIPIMTGLIFMSLQVFVITTSPPEFLKERVFAVVVLFAMLGLTWLQKRAEVQDKIGSWQEVATRTGLTCKVSGWLQGAAVSVVGTYRTRLVTLFSPTLGKAQVASTRIEVMIENPTEAALRVRGPFKRNEVLYDRVTNNLFAGSNSRQFGNDQRFFIRSNPIHLATSLVSAKTVWPILEKLEHLVSLELNGNTLSFEQTGILRDVEQLQSLFDLLSDLADMIEQRNKAFATVPVRHTH